MVEGVPGGGQETARRRHGEATSDEVKELKAEARQLKETLAEVLIENRLLIKSGSRATFLRIATCVDGRTSSLATNLEAGARSSRENRASTFSLMTSSLPWPGILAVAQQATLDFT